MSKWQDMLGWDSVQLSELRYIGYVYLKEGQYETAKQLYEGLVLLDPNNDYDWRTLGALYLFMNQYPKAIEVLNKALEINPANPGAQLNLAKAYLYQGDRIRGLGDAKKLMSSLDKDIARDAEALVMAYNG
ncbi:MAG: tetratricopeptide repeat protein [Chlamydiota bacterium]